jgi:hypothetical protein
MDHCGTDPSIPTHIKYTSPNPPHILCATPSSPSSSPISYFTAPHPLASYPQRLMQYTRPRCRVCHHTCALASRDAPATCPPPTLAALDAPPPNRGATNQRRQCLSTFTCAQVSDVFSFFLHLLSSQIPAGRLAFFTLLIAGCLLSQVSLIRVRACMWLGACVVVWFVWFRSSCRAVAWLSVLSVFRRRMSRPRCLGTCTFGLPRSFMSLVLVAGGLHKRRMADGVAVAFDVVYVDATVVAQRRRCLVHPKSVPSPHKQESHGECWTR